MIKRVISLFLAFALLSLAFCSCSSADEYKDRVIYGMDTYTTVRLSDERLSDERFEELCREASLIIAKNEKLMSAYDSASRVYDFNNGADMILSPDKSLLSVLETAANVSAMTDGAYLHTIGALTLLWNVTDGGPVPSDADIDVARSHIGTSGIKIADGNVTKNDDGCKLDLGGVANGYTVQEIVEYFASSGVSSGLVSVGRSIGVFGEKESGDAFKVGICDPQSTDELLGYLNIKSGFISVSSTAEKAFSENGETYHHIIDPATGRPADSDLTGVAVWCQSGAIADALSTAFIVMGKDKALAFCKEGKLAVEAVFVCENGEVVTTDGLRDGVFELQSDAYTLTE